jgi:hypothetical protein
MGQVHQKGRDQSNRKTEETRKNASRSSDRDLNPGSQEYTTGMLTTHPQSSVSCVEEDFLKIISHRSPIYIASINLARIYDFLSNK